MSTPGRNDPCPCGSGRKYKTCCLDADRKARHVGLSSLSTTVGPTSAGGSGAVWQAELVPYPLPIGDDPAARPCVALVVEGDAPVWAELHRRPGGESEEVAELLAAAVLAAADKWRRMPARVEARHPEVVEALAAKLEARGVPVATRTTLESLDLLATTLVAGANPGQVDPFAPRPSTSFARTWAGWALPDETMAALFAAAAAFYRGRPWDAIHAEALLSVEATEGRAWSLSVLGADDVEYGLSMYSDAADRDRLLAELFFGLGVTDLFEGRALCLTFEPADRLPPPMRREVRRSGWEVAGPDAYPVLFTINTPGGGISDADARDLTAALRAVAAGAHRLAAANATGTEGSWTDPETGTTLVLSASLSPRGAPSGALRSGPPPAVHRVAITLEGVEPPIWRRVEVPSDLPLRDLSDVVQEAMGWAGDHLYRFEVDGVAYGEADEDGWLDDDEDPGVPLSEVAAEPGARLRYVYDFGDDWAHEMVVEAVTEPEDGATYPRCVAGARACPPEDCGGVGGYYRVLEALGSPHAGDVPDPAYTSDPGLLDDREVEELRAWAGDFDPERFDLDQTNRSLVTLARGSSPDPAFAERFDELRAIVGDVVSVDELPLDLVNEALEILHAYAMEDRAGFMAGRKPEILVAAAFHSAGMILDRPWRGWRPTLEELAERFGVSVASISSRSRAIRDVVWRPHPFWGFLDDAVPKGVAASGLPRGSAHFPELVEAVGWEPTEGSFDVRVLAGLTGLDDDDVAVLTEVLERALDRERTRRGWTDPDPRSLAERLEDEEAFGAALREALRADDVSAAARAALARWVVGRLPLTGPSSLVSIPTSSLLAVSHLAEHGALRGEALADAVILALEGARDPEEGLAAVDVRPLVRAVATDDEVDRDERLAILCDLLERTAWGRDGRVGPDLVNVIADEEEISVDVRYDVLGHISGLFDAVPGSVRLGPAVRRRALVRRIRLEEDPESLIEPLLDTEADREVRWLAAAELLESDGSKLPRVEAAELVRRGLAADRAVVRQAFFRAGLALLGDDVREWAPEGVTGPLRGPGGASLDDADASDQMRLL